MFTFTLNDYHMQDKYANYYLNKYKKNKSDTRSIESKIKLQHIKNTIGQVEEFLQNQQWELYEDTVSAKNITLQDFYSWIRNKETDIMLMTCSKSAKESNWLNAEKINTVMKELYMRVNEPDHIQDVMNKYDITRSQMEYIKDLL